MARSTDTGLSGADDLATLAVVAVTVSRDASCIDVWWRACTPNSSFSRCSYLLRAETISAQALFLDEPLSFLGRPPFVALAKHEDVVLLAKEAAFRLRLVLSSGAMGTHRFRSSIGRFANGTIGFEERH